MLLPIEVSVRVQWREGRNGDPQEKLKRAIRKAYRINDRRMPMRDSVTVEKAEKNHPEEPGEPYIARLKTESPFGCHTVSSVENAVTKAVEGEFGTSIVGARITVENDENRCSFGW